MGLKLHCLVARIQPARILLPARADRMSESKTLEVPRRHRIVWTVLWLGALALMWAGVSMLARRTGRPAAFVMAVLTALVLTYLLTWAWAIAISRARRRTFFRGLRTTLTLLIILVCLEAPAALNLVHWGMLFQRWVGEEDHFTTAFVSDPELAFRRRPHDHWSGQPRRDIEASDRPPSQREPIQFTTDHWGYRNVTDLEHADVVLIGDSFIEGYHVSDEQTAARAL